MSAKMGKFRIDTDFVSQGDRNWLIANGLVGAFEYLRQSGVFHGGYFECQQSEKITPEFHTTRGKIQGDMVDALEAARNEPLPAYADLMDKLNEDGVDSLRLMLDPVEELEEE
ncbi:hypothetical protein Hanom_Chr11g01014641 [Helianthus anomalus]